MTFDGATLTTTDGASVIQVTTDHSLTKVDDHPVSWDGLSFGSINTPDALQGTHGADCMKVHGDTFERLQGNLEIDVNKRLAPALPAGNVIVNIDGNSTTAYHGNVTMTFQPIGADPGVYTETYYGPVQSTHLDDVVKNLLADYMLNQPDDGTWEHKKYDRETIAEQISVVALQIDVSALHLEATAVHVEVIGGHAEGTGAHAEGTLVHYEAKVLHKSDVINEMDAHLEDTQIALLREQLKVVDDKNAIIEIQKGVEMHLGIENHFGEATFMQIIGTGLIAPG